MQTVLKYLLLIMCGSFCASEELQNQTNVPAIFFSYKLYVEQETLIFSNFHFSY